MLRIARVVLLTLAVLAAAGTILLAFLSFTRKVETFTRAGFSYDTSRGELDRDGRRAARRGGRGRAGARRPHPARRRAAWRPPWRGPDASLARKPFPHRLVVRRGELDIPRSAACAPRRRHRQALPLPRLRRVPLPAHRPLHGRAPQLRAGGAVFLALCLASFAVYVLTPSGPPDAIYSASWFGDAFYRALLPALLLHFFLVFPRRVRPRLVLPLLYLPAAAYLAGTSAPAARGRPAERCGARAAHRSSGTPTSPSTGSPCCVRAGGPAARAATDAESEKQVRWIGPRASPWASRPFLLLSVLPRAFGSGLAAAVDALDRVSLVLIPLAFCVRDPQVAALGRRDVRARGAGDDRRRCSWRHDVRAPQHAARPDVRRRWRRPARTSSRSARDSCSPRSWCR